MKYKILAAFFVTAVLLSSCAERSMAMEKSYDQKREKLRQELIDLGVPEKCKGKQDSKDSLDCQYPPPPLGRWKAVYTRDFATAHNLPLENISTDLSPGVDYMEMEVMSLINGYTVCFASMLSKKPHDIALYGVRVYLPQFSKDKKMTNLIDLEKHKNRLKPIATFESASRDYVSNRRGYRQSTVAMYAEDVLPDYDYISANVHCRDISMHPQYFPDGYAFWVNKASVWGRYENQYRNLDAPGRPKGDQVFDRSHFFINIPHELVSAIFDGIVIGGK